MPDSVKNENCTNVHCKMMFKMISSFKSLLANNSPRGVCNQELEVPYSGLLTECRGNTINFTISAIT